MLVIFRTDKAEEIFANMEELWYSEEEYPMDPVFFTTESVGLKMIQFPSSTWEFGVDWVKIDGSRNSIANVIDEKSFAILRDIEPILYQTQERTWKWYETMGTNLPSWIGKHDWLLRQDVDKLNSEQVFSYGDDIIRFKNLCWTVPRDASYIEASNMLSSAAFCIYNMKDGHSTEQYTSDNVRKYLLVAQTALMRIYDSEDYHV